MATPDVLSGPPVEHIHPERAIELVELCSGKLGPGPLRCRWCVDGNASGGFLEFPARRGAGEEQKVRGRV
jgi:hypothetical protein